MRSAVRPSGCESEFEFVSESESESEVCIQGVCTYQGGQATSRRRAWVLPREPPPLERAGGGGGGGGRGGGGGAHPLGGRSVLQLTRQTPARRGHESIGGD